MTFSLRFRGLIMAALFLVATGRVQANFHTNEKQKPSSSKQKSYSTKKKTQPVPSDSQQSQPRQETQEPQEPKIISLLGVHHAPRAFGNAVLPSVSRDAIPDQLLGSTVEELFQTHFVGDDQNFLTTIQNTPLTPVRTSNAYCPEGTFTLLLNDGRPFSWGDLFPSGSIVAPSLPAGRSIVMMTSSRFAFAGLLDDGGLISWGKDQSSLTSTMEAPSVPSGTKVISIASTPTSFAALLDNGKVLAWGNRLYGGLAPEIPIGKKAIALFSNGWSFSALLDDRTTVISWGQPRYGGAGIMSGADPIRAIVSTDAAFALLRGDHQIEAWGDSAHGGIVPALPQGTVDALIPNEVAFTALFHDGTIVCWGEANGGGTTPVIPPLVTTVQPPTPDPITTTAEDGTETTVQPPTPDPVTTITPRTVVSVVGNDRAFAALLNDGTLIAWGDPIFGAVVPSAVAGKKFTSLAASQEGFSAFFDGGVFCWGRSMPQGDFVSLPLEKSITSLATTREAFAAVLSDGTLQCWGVANCGGTTPNLFGKKVTALTSNDHAFMALLEDGTPFVWGEGGSSVLPALPQDRIALSLVSPFFSQQLHFKNKLSGIVVIGNTTTTQGLWQYAAAWSETWNSLPLITSTDAGLVLESSTRLRFLPAADFSGAPPPLVVKLLDNSVSPKNGEILDVTVLDPIAPYSTEVIPLTTEVTESFWESLL